MSAMIERVYRVREGKIQKLIEGERYYDVDWGYKKDPDYWVDICDDTPENRKKYYI